MCLILHITILLETGVFKLLGLKMESAENDGKNGYHPMNFHLRPGINNSGEKDERAVRMKLLLPQQLTKFVCVLFEEHSELLTLFDKFKELKTKEDQANSLELAEHAGNVMNTLDEGIKSLDNLDAFFEYLHQVGASHRRIPGFKVEYFWRIEKPFLTAVETTLGDRYTENVENIYKITIKFIIETLIKGFENTNAPT